MHGAFYHHLQGRIGFNTVNPSLSTGKVQYLPRFDGARIQLILWKYKNTHI